MNTHKIVRGLLYGAGVAYIALFLFTATLRLFYPYEVEWNEGAVLDHAIRAMNGMPVYTAPSLDFSAFVYTPLYYFVTALTMKIGGVGLWAGRLISIVSTLVTAWIAARIVQQESGSRDLAFASAALYIAFYHITGFFYDIVRMDALAVVLASGSLYVAMYSRRGFIYAALLTALAYFTKQQMIFIFPAIAVGFFFRNKRLAFVYSIATLMLIFLGSIIWNFETNGWFRFFTTTVPAAKAAQDFSVQKALEFFPIMVMGTLGFFTLVIVVGFFSVGKNLWRGANSFLIPSYFFALLSADASLANPGGYQNVLMPLTAMMAILFPLSIDALAKKFPEWHNAMQAITLLGFLALFFNPLGETMLLASSHQKKAGDLFIARVHAIPGDVWIPFHGYLAKQAGKHSHVHFMAMLDAMATHDTTAKHLQHDIDSSLAAHRFSAIILDEQHVFSWDSIAHYQRSSAILTEPNVFLSRIGDAPTRPNVLFVPSP